MRSILLLPLGLLLGFSAALVFAQDKVVIAHRGASGYLPEHTLEAKVLAFAQGADYLEQDVVMTADDHLIVFHDLTLERMTNVAQVFPERAREDGSFYVIDFTLEELRTLKVSEGSSVVEGERRAGFPGRFPLEPGFFRIHTLDAELKLIAGLAVSTGRTVGIYPELKSPWFHHQHGKDLARAVLEVLAAHGYRDSDDPVYVQSFDYPELVRVKHELLPELGLDLKLVQLIADNSWGETMALDASGVWQPYDYAWMLTQAGVKQLATVVDGVGPAYDMLVPATLTSETAKTAVSPFVQWAHLEGLQVHPYTFRKDPERLPPWVDSFDALLELFLYRLEVDGVFTDFPDLARQFVDRQFVESHPREGI
jgi:glycerophosphoryl diester phosphodiesterase